MRNALIVGLTVGVILGVAGAAGGALEVGAKAPQVKLATAAGKEVALSSGGQGNLLLLFLPRGGSYVSGPRKLPFMARPVKRLHYERELLAGYETRAIVIHPGPASDGAGATDIATTVHDPQGQAYRAFGLTHKGRGSGSWAAFFIDKTGVIRLRWLPLGWKVKKATGRGEPDLLDIYAEIEKHLGLSKIPADAKVARFQQGASGYSGCVSLQIWPRYKKPESLATKQTAFVRAWTGGEFIIIQFQEITGRGRGRIPPKAKVHKAYLRMSTINHASTQKVTLHQMTTAWDVNATYHRSLVARGKDVPWQGGDLGVAGANFKTEPAVKGDYQIPINYGDVQWDVTPAVRDWVAGKANYGLAVLAEKGYQTPDHACFAMSPFFRASQRPQLIVYYGPAAKSGGEPASPDEAKANALLATAKVHLKLRLPNKAKGMLQEIIDKYPDTAAAAKATAMLKDLK